MVESPQDLLGRIEAGDPAAVGDLIDRFGPSARRLAQALLGDDALAEDAVQEAFLVALAKLPVLRAQEAFGAWLRQIVRTACGRRSRRRRRETAGLPEDQSASGPGPLEALAEREVREAVRRAVGRLPPTCRLAVVRFHLEGVSLREVAADLDVPLGTVKRRLFDARRRLADILIGFDGGWAR